MIFERLAVDGRARRGRLQTPHGTIDTPAFMPVGTRATVKGLAPDQIAATGAQIVLANTYHLALRPGADVVEKLGGLHRFMNWPHPVLTDSGGFQVFSLSDLRSLDDAGVSFRSHIDGALVHLSPESSIRIQNQLGADIIMCFDECPPLTPESRVDDEVASTPNRTPQHADLAGVEQAVRRTLAWAQRCKAAHARADESAAGPPQALYGIVQGGLDVALRRACLSDLAAIEFDGYAIGGLSVGEPPPQMWALLHDFADELPRERPRYLMGVGTPRDLVEAVAAGVDQFDCVLPTRNGRKGYAFTAGGTVRLRNAQHRLSAEPLDAECACYACRGFSRGYLRHLLSAGETLGGTLVSLHNLAFYQRLMARMRAAIEAGTFAKLHREITTGPLANPARESDE